MLQTQLVDLSHVSSKFLSSVVEQSRISLQKEHSEQKQSDLGIQAQLNKVITMLEGQCHDPELLAVYIILSINLAIHFLGCIAIQFLKTRITNWFLRQNQMGLMMGICTNTQTYTVPEAQIDQPCNSQCCTP